MPNFLVVAGKISRIEFELAYQNYVKCTNTAALTMSGDLTLEKVSQKYEVSDELLGEGTASNIDLVIC